MTRFPTTSRRVARVAYRAARQKWRTRTLRLAEVHHAGLRRIAARRLTWRIALAKHTPTLDGDTLVCSVCVEPAWLCDDGCCGPAPQLSYPCAVVLDVAEQATGTPSRPARPVAPRWSDYYREPQVRVTLAHPLRVDEVRHPPGRTLLLPLSFAQRLRIRITPDSWRRVEAATRRDRA